MPGIGEAATALRLIFYPQLFVYTFFFRRHLEKRWKVCWEKVKMRRGADTGYFLLAITGVDCI